MKHKLVVFDLDGTIIDETLFIWKTIHEHFKTDNSKSRLKAMKRFYNGDISYEQWAQNDIDLWKEMGATKKEIMKSISSLKLMPGTRETLTELKKRGHKLAIISGSLNIALEKVLPDYKKFFDYVFLNRIFFDNKGHITTMEATKYDIEHKLTGLKHIAEKEGLTLKDCVFIGDSDYDRFIAEKAGFSIAFNCSSDKLAEISDVVIKKKDLRKILKYIE